MKKIFIFLAVRATGQRLVSERRRYDDRVGRERDV
jgi:hypothetical protein